MSSMSEQISQLLTFLRDLRTARMLSLSSIAALIYDIVLSFPEELDYIWRAPWSGGKILYLAGRYPPLGVIISWMIYNVGFSGSMFNVCVGVSYLETWGLWLVQVPIQIILSLRTFAVWHRDRRVAALLLLCASGYYITIIVCSIKLTKTNHFIRNPLIDALHECYSDVVLTESLTLSKWAFGTLMFFDGVMFLLILSKAIMTDRKFRARILNILLRDGTIYYTVIFGISFANVLLATTLSAQRGILAISVSNALLAAQSIGASNIVLSLRKFSSQAQLAPTRWQSNSGIGVRIAGRPTLVDELTPQNATDATESIEL